MIFVKKEPHPNHLSEIPDQEAEDYLGVASIIPRLVHLQPPTGLTKVRLDRFSPYYKLQSINKGYRSFFRNIRPLDAYDFVLPSNINSKRAAYYFDHDTNTTEEVAEALSTLQQSINWWKQRWTETDRPRLLFRNGLRSGHVSDSRKGASQRSFKVSGDYHNMANTLLGRSLPESLLATKLQLSSQRIGEILTNFDKQGLVLRIDGRVLWLPTQFSS